MMPVPQSWKETLVDSESKSNEVLRCLAREMGYKNKLTGICCGGQCSVSIKEPHSVSRDIFDFSFSIMGQVCCLWRLKFDEYERGHGYAGMAMKALFGVGHEHGIVKVHIHGIMDDGWSFWPYWGGIDKEACEGSFFKDSIIAVSAFDLSLPCHEEERAAVRNIADMVEDDSEKAWHAVAQSKIIRPSSKAEIFKRASRRNCMTIDLMDMTTQKILTDRLGVLPPFPTVDTFCLNPSSHFLVQQKALETASL